jgi:polyhydroxyalkanoate synthesis regulator protein
MSVVGEKTEVPTVVHRHKNRKYYDTKSREAINLTKIFSLHREGDIMVTTKSSEDSKKKETDITEDTVLQAIFKVVLNGRFENRKTRGANKKILDESQLSALRKKILDCVREL